MRLIIAAFAMTFLCAPAFAQDMSADLDAVASDAAALQQSQDADAQNGYASGTTFMDQQQLESDQEQARIDAINNEDLGD